MPLVPMRQVLEEAAKGGYGVGAFNVNNMEQIQAIMQACKETKSPVIIQASRGALKYANMIYLEKLMEAAAIENPEIPIVMHLDHGNSLATCKEAIALGFTSVMIDASLEADGKTVASYEYNVETTRSVVEYAHALGVTVEAELGALGGIEDGHGAGLAADDTEHLTNPEQVVDFVTKTGCDALAVAIGTSHGAYKTMRFDKNGNAMPPALALDLITEIVKKLDAAGYKNFPLVMHGSSSVPQDLVAIVNKFGGAMKQSMGIPMADIKVGITRGVRKINVDTDGRIAMTGAIRKMFAEKPEVFDPRTYLAPARTALYELIKGKVLDFGQAGHAADYAPMTLEDAKKKWYGGKSSCGCCCCG
ncbi:MAG TPA: ketose-bisphosphate aldolase [Candidatus Sumerlaeota bacterium]|nr:ketose-bisphosphate aldolase [Candidatus Sumerlaeota bacterium]HPS03026.1 ketose-bisphosphate aldolase [Candidatus Sumerlaeota bacterium]